MKMVEVEGVTFCTKEVKLPVSIPGGSKTKLLGFDATIYKNRTPDCIDDPVKSWEHVLDILSGLYADVIHISDTESYIKDIDLYIESRLNYKHNFNAYQPNNKFHIDALNQLIETNSTEIIKQWCIDDPKKRELMIIQNKKYLEIFVFRDKEDLLNQTRRVVSGLKRSYDTETLFKELAAVHKSKGNYNSTPIYNKLVTHFNKAIVANENTHYQNPINRRRQIENCLFLQYITEPELTDDKILVNYRFNKYVPYYSYFSPMWAKKFAEEYSPKRILDPFGGWGHRYLAFLDYEYIYNDFWGSTFDGVRKIHEFCIERLSLPEKKFHNEDAGAFAFNAVEEYDTVFTCPPYENLEKYNNKTFKNSRDFLDLWDRSVSNSIHNDLKTFAFIVKSTLAPEMIKICTKRGLELIKDQPLGANTNHHYNRLKNVKKLEHLYVFH